MSGIQPYSTGKTISMKSILPSLILVLTTAMQTAYSQSTAKADAYLAVKSQAAANGSLQNNKPVSILVQGDIGGIKKLTESNNGTFKYSYGNIAAITIPPAALPAFLHSPSVTRMEGAPPHIRALNDTMRMRNHIVEVQMGQAPLAQGYTGKGVIIGIIDAGIDFLHPDFRDSLDSTRIQYLWDMNRPNNQFTPAPYGYGQAWSKKQMDSVYANPGADTAEIDTMDLNAQYSFSHGSHVSGVAAGNARSNGLNKGVAYDADLIVVSYNFNNQTNNEINDAANFIYTEATKLGKPCVINASLGDYEGSHDGLDLSTQMLNNMITAQSSRAFVAASGNSGATDYHVQYNLAGTDTLFSWFPYYDGGSIDIQVYADTAAFRNVKFAIGADQITPVFSSRAQSNFSSIFPFLAKYGKDTLRNGAGQIIGIDSITASLSGGVYFLDNYITPDSTACYWRLVSTGTGKFDCWSFDPYGNPAPIVNSGLPSPANYPEIVHYHLPDTLQTVCSGFQCSPDVITVANYNNRRWWVNYNGYLHTSAGFIPGAIALNSSKGPTRTGAVKPEIAATGNNTLSCLATQYRSYNIAHLNDTANMDQGAWHFIDGGTSTASPVIAGTAALLFEAYPSATADEIKNLIICGAVQDTFTGSHLPDNTWGFGKVNAFNSFTQCRLGFKSLITSGSDYLLDAYPNPMNKSTIITYDFSALKQYSSACIVVYDIMGKVVQTIKLNNSKGSAPLTNNSLASGIYFYSLTVDGARLKTEKLAVN